MVLREHHEDRGRAAAETRGIYLYLSVHLSEVNDVKSHLVTCGMFLLVSQDKEGGFVVRESSQKGVYTVSVYTKTLRFIYTTASKLKVNHLYKIPVNSPASLCSSTGDIRHYQIKISDTGQFFLAEKHTFISIPDVIHYHEHNAAGAWTSTV